MVFKQSEGDTGGRTRGDRRRMLLASGSTHAARGHPVAKVLPRKAHAAAGTVGAAVDAAEKAEGNIRRGKLRDACFLLLEYVACRMCGCVFFPSSPAASVVFGSCTLRYVTFNGYPSLIAGCGSLSWLASQRPGGRVFSSPLSDDVIACRVCQSSGVVSVRTVG